MKYRPDELPDDPDVRLRTVRAKRRSMQRQALARARDFSLAAALASAGGALQCGVLAARRLSREVAWGGGVLLLMALGLAVLALLCLRRHRRLRRETDAARRDR